MSATGLDVFDKTLQTTNTWLNEITEQIGPDRQIAWKVLSVVLHKLRDRLPLGLAVHLGAELPILIRGVYYDQFEPAKLPTDWNLDAFVAETERWLSDVRPINPQDAIRAVMKVLSHYVPPGQIDKVRGALPADIREFWLSIEQRTPEPRRRSA